MDDVMHEVRMEADTADRRYGPFSSTHEAYGVLAEEMAELLAAVRANRLESVRLEAIQVAAVAARCAACCRGHAAFAERSSAT
jgi:hypothetical protein